MLAYSSSPAECVAKELHVVRCRVLLAVVLAGEVALQARAGASDGKRQPIQRELGTSSMLLRSRAREATRSFGALGSIDITRESSGSGSATYTHRQEAHDMISMAARSHLARVLSFLRPRLSQLQCHDDVCIHIRQMNTSTRLGQRRGVLMEGLRPSRWLASRIPVLYPRQRHALSAAHGTKDHRPPA